MATKTVKQNVEELRATLKGLADSGALHVSTHQQMVADAIALVDEIATQVGAKVPTPVVTLSPTVEPAKATPAKSK